MMNFILAMVLYPDAQQAAQAELDRVVGRNRMPEFSDRENLPYMNALISEILRWHPIIPLGVPHKLTTNSEEVFRGMRLPKGSVILPNAW